MYISCHSGNVRAPHGADNFGTGVLDSSLSSHSLNTLVGPVVGVWKRKDKSYFDNVSLIYTDPFQVSSHFPNLLIGVYSVYFDIFNKYCMITNMSCFLFEAKYGIFVFLNIQS